MPFDKPVQILKGPGDIADWAETARITRVEFQQGDFFVRHTKEGKRADSWPPEHVPGWGDKDRGGSDPGDLQWTLYVVIDGGGGWVTAPCILYYPEDTPSLGVHRGGDGAPFSSGARNWWYQVGGMAGRQPSAGQRIGLLAVAGGLRELDVLSVRERSNICWLTVPANDTGVFEFPAEPAPAPPAPAPEPPPVPPAPTKPDTPPDTPAHPLPLDAQLLEHLEDLTSGLAMACQGLLRASTALQAALTRRR